jgi:hypothetical protein
VWRQRRGTLLIVSANIAVAVTIAFVTAVLALVVEGLLPVDGPRKYSGLRWSVLAVAVVLLIAVIAWRSTIRRHRGTLFYVRLLDQTMNDWHVRAVDLAARRRLALRPVTRWVDLSSHTDHGLIDLVGPTEKLTTELRRAILTSPADAGITVAPNLLWPVALAVGAELPPVNHLTLLELPGARADAQKREIQFVPPTQPAPPGLTRETLGVEDAKTMPGCRPGTGRLGVLLAFGPNAQHMDPAKIFPPFGVSDYYRIRPAWIPVDLAGLTANSFTGPQLATLTHALTEQLTHIKNKNSDRQLVAAAALPKALALALGFGIAQSSTRFLTGTHLLHYDSDSQSYLPLRVAPSQPNSPPTP